MKLSYNYCESAFAISRPVYPFVFVLFICSPKNYGSNLFLILLNKSDDDDTVVSFIDCFM